MGALSPLMKKDFLSRLLMKQVDASRAASSGARTAERKAKAMQAYSCHSCGDLHHGEDDAASCCDPIEIEAYQCGRCDRLYRDRDRAEKCCVGRKPTQSEMSALMSALKSPAAPTLRAVECPVCGDEFGEEGTDAGNEGWPYAARCCLGADLSPAQTWELARLVRYGRLEWTEAIDRVAGGAP
ncbi:MAG: hypothetical protein RLZZ373_3234 [Pseudomonadota bacterium]|jgi:hypothetical protein